MKVYVVFMLILCAPTAFGSLSADVDTILHDYEDDCARQTGVSIDNIELARKPRRLPDSGELDTFAVCMLKKFNIMTEDGSVNPDSRSYRLFTDNVYIQQTSDICKVQHGTNIGETARKIINCFLSRNEIVMALIPTRM